MKRLVFLAFLVPGIAAGAEPAPHFDRDVQPLIARCVSCHGPGKARGGLRLDSREGATAVLDSENRAIVAGKPEESELLRRVADPGEGRMPPKGEMLTAAQVDVLRHWIAAGADWPKHWAYRALDRPPPPDIPETLRTWARNPIDAFVLEKQREHKLTPGPEVDKRTLLRRLTFDLTGLPPTPAELDRFLADQSTDAYEKVVHRLLASPQYGERQARHWMDLVHFAETHGHDQDRPRDHAWRYREYLIGAFNQDRPYGRFVQEQVAGDVLFPNDPQALIATGFLAAGPWDESSLKDIREDSIDREIGRYLDRDDIVTSVISTFASTTVGCARCHNHKFDPITQADYYALQSVFAGIEKGDHRFDVDPAIAVRRQQLTEQRARLRSGDKPAESVLLDEALQNEVAAWEKHVESSWQALAPVEVKSEEGATLTPQADNSVVSEGKRPEKDTYTIVLRPDMKTITALRLEALTDANLPHQGPGRNDNGNFHLNEVSITVAPLSEPMAGKKVVLASASADFDQQGWTAAHAIDGNPATAWGIYPQVGKPHAIAFTFKEPLAASGVTLTVRLKQSHGSGHLMGRFRLSASSATQPWKINPLPTDLSSILAIAPTERTPRQRADLAACYLGEKLDRELAALPPLQLVYCGTSTPATDAPGSPPRPIRPVRILKRGDVGSPEALATPGTLAFLDGLPSRFELPEASGEGARRAALARWLTDPRNALAWRSIANRVWQTHFGKGLVDTPNDFGKMGSSPTHPELLDFLAATLRDNGGSLKELHRLIVTSATYRQGWRDVAEYAAADADNRFLWRSNRQRLDAESIHDAVLQISGKLDLTMGGPSVRQFIMTQGVHATPDIDYASFDVDAPTNQRRSVYRFLFRTLPDPFMESLDCPDGSQSTPVRSGSITALQALAVWNDKFMVRQAEHIAARIATTKPTQTEQVEELYRLILGRAPSAKEAKAVGAYVTRNGLANTCRIVLNSNEFIFVD
jgi:hypothetical protein